MKKNSVVARVDPDFYNYINDLAKKEDRSHAYITKKIFGKLKNKGKMRIEI